jgi:hypothetical protein
MVEGQLIVSKILPMRVPVVSPATAPVTVVIAEVLNILKASKAVMVT